MSCMEAWIMFYSLGCVALGLWVWKMERELR